MGKSKEKRVEVEFQPTENYDLFNTVKPYDSYNEYEFKDGTVLKLNKELSIKSTNINGLVIIKKDNLYGVGVRKDNIYKIIQPKYKAAYLNDVSFIAEDDKKLYVLSRKNRYNVNNYFDDLKEYNKDDQSDLVKFLLSNFSNVLKIYESDGNLIIHHNDLVYIFDKESGKLSGKRRKTEHEGFGPKAYYDGGSIIAGKYDDSDNYWLYNIRNDKKINVLNAFSDFYNGRCAYKKTNGTSYIIDTNFNSKEFVYRYEAVRSGNEIPIESGKYIEVVQTGWGNPTRYGFIDFDNNIIIKLKYKTMDAAEKALEKYINKINKKALKEQEKLLIDDKDEEDISEEDIIEETINDNEIEEVKPAENELDILENKINKYLGYIKVDGLEKSFEEKRDNYNKTINSVVEEEKEDIKNLLYNNTLTLRTNDTASNIYNNYKHDLMVLLDYLDNDMYIQIKYTLGKMNGIIAGDKINISGNELLKDVYSLYIYIIKLDDELKEKNIKRFREVITNYQKYFDGYINKTNTEECKFTSMLSWEADFREQFKKLLYSFKADYDFEQELHNRLNMESDIKNIENDRYKSLDLYVNEIHKTIKEIEEMTNDEFYLSLIDKYRSIKADYNYNLEETTEQLNKSLQELYRIKKDVEFGIAPEKYKR